MQDDIASKRPRVDSCFLSLSLFISLKFALMGLAVTLDASSESSFFLVVAENIAVTRPFELCVAFSRSMGRRRSYGWSSDGAAHNKRKAKWEWYATDDIHYLVPVIGIMVQGKHEGNMP